jgi:predicted flap endonuclease-1-like 5' DNA nuclease
MMLAATLANSWLATLIFFQNSSIPTWVPLVIILLIILLFWWGLTRNRIPDETGDAVEAHETAAEEPVVAETSPDVASEMERTTTTDEPPSPLEPDDLKQIEGIGPKIAGILADAGITTFTELAETDAATLDKIVREDAGIKIANPASWPQQAALASAADWDGLAEMQKRLASSRHRE